MSRPAVYTIAHPDVLARSLAEGGSGSLQEGHKWTAAASQFKALQDQKRSEYLLLICDAVRVNGVEWVALVEKIEVDDQSTLIRFRDAVPLKTPIPLTQLTKLSDGKPLANNHIRSYVPCVLNSEDAAYVLRSIKKRRASIGFDAAWEAISSAGPEKWLAALRAVEPRMTTEQHAMLLAHARAPLRTLSMQALSDAGGYDGHASANMQYGRLGRLFANELGATDLLNQTQAVATAAPERDQRGQRQWTLRRPLAEAMAQLGWIEALPQQDVSGEGSTPLSAAAIEIANDPSTEGVPETVRQALICARVGQGEYRERLMELWNGRCALTGAAIGKALIASHVLPWATATNEQRLDKYNGLLLAASADRLFDCGLISFTDEGKLLKAEHLQDEDLTVLGIKPGSSLKAISPKHFPYLAAHRDKYGFTTRSSTKGEA